MQSVEPSQIRFLSLFGAQLQLFLFFLFYDVVECRQVIWFHKFVFDLVDGVCCVDLGFRLVLLVLELHGDLLGLS